MKCELPDVPIIHLIPLRKDGSRGYVKVSCEADENGNGCMWCRLLEAGHPLAVSLRKRQKPELLS